MGRHSLVESQTNTAIFETLTHPELAMLKQRGASTLRLGDRQRLGVEINDDTHWLSMPQRSAEGDFTIQLAGVLVTPDNKTYGLAEVVRMWGSGVDRRVLLTQLAGHQYGQAKVARVLTPDIIARKGSMEDMGWSVAVGLTGDMTEMLDRVSIQHNGDGATEYIGAAAGHVQLADMLPLNMWAPTASEVRWALQQP